MILGIDASNIRAGGGLTHLSKTLEAGDPIQYGFQKVIVWGGRASLEKMPAKPWLMLNHEPLLDKSLRHRIRWQRSILPATARDSCQLLFLPGSTGVKNSTPYVTLSQNMLPFEYKEAMRYGASWTLVRLLLLRVAQGNAFKNADGIIFLTQYARKEILSKTTRRKVKQTVIPHGIEKRFFREPGLQRSLTDFSFSDPFTLLYVSIVDLYKHQWVVARAAADLRKQGYPLEVHFVGPAYPPALSRLKKTIQQIDPQGQFLHYRGPIPHDGLHSEYHNADGFVFASSCENLPIIVLEAMAAGLPIACSNRGPMPEVLGDSGVYFDPENQIQTANAIQNLLEDTNLRKRFASEAYQKAQGYSWHKCATETFSFLKDIAQTNPC